MKKAILHGTGMIKRFEETEVLHGIDIYMQVILR